MDTWGSRRSRQSRPWLRTPPVDVMRERRALLEVKTGAMAIVRSATVDRSRATCTCRRASRYGTALTRSPQAMVMVVEMDTGRDSCRVLPIDGTFPTGGAAKARFTDAAWSPEGADYFMRMRETLHTAPALPGRRGGQGPRPDGEQGLALPGAPVAHIVGRLVQRGVVSPMARVTSIRWRTRLLAPAPADGEKVLFV